MGQTIRRDEDEEIFWRRLVLPEEDRRRLFPGVEWLGGYRWFRSPNVVPIEQIRQRKRREQREEP
jgi:hypothetical protein